MPPDVSAPANGVKTRRADNVPHDATRDCRRRARPRRLRRRRSEAAGARRDRRFTAERDLALYRIDPRTHRERRLSPQDARDSQPAWSPDGGTIVFVRETINGSGLWLMDADGRHVRKLHAADASASPSWSPEGTKIAYNGEVDGIWLLDLGSGEARHISRGYDEHPSWSPRLYATRIHARRDRKRRRLGLDDARRRLRPTPTDARR